MDGDNLTSNFARHLIDTNHGYTGFESNLKTLHFCDKGQLLDAWEEFEIYKKFKESPQQMLNDQLSFDSHILYDTIIEQLISMLCIRKKKNK